VEAFSDEGGKAHWIVAGSGDFIEVPSNAKHGFRNRSHQPVIQLITTTSKLGRFFQEVGRSVTHGVTMSPPAPDELNHFLETAGRHGYWLATPKRTQPLASLFPSFHGYPDSFRSTEIHCNFKCLPRISNNSYSITGLGKKSFEPQSRARR
jgi:hypothetical protein